MTHQPIAALESGSVNRRSELSESGASGGGSRGGEVRAPSPQLGQGAEPMVGEGQCTRKMGVSEPPEAERFSLI